MLRKISWKSFAMGAAASVVGASVLHPILVSVAKVGIGAVSVAQDAWQQASEELHRVRDEARASTAANASAAANNDAVLNELRALRSDVSAVKSKVGLA